MPVVPESAHSHITPRPRSALKDYLEGDSKMCRKLPAIMLLALAVPAYAHHSLWQAYLVDEVITVEGVVTEFLLRSPHSFIFIEVLAEDGQTETWAVEWGNTVGMAKDGYDKDTIQPGDRIIVTGEPARDSARTWVHLQTLHRPADGFRVDNVRQGRRGSESTN